MINIEEGGGGVHPPGKICAPPWQFQTFKCIHYACIHRMITKNLFFYPPQKIFFKRLCWYILDLPLPPKKSLISMLIFYTSVHCKPYIEITYLFTIIWEEILLISNHNNI